MAEIFWNSWSNESSRASIDHLFDAILLKKESVFPDHIIVPEFKDQEKITLVTHIPPLYTTKENETLLYLFSQVLAFIPKKAETKILLECVNPDIASIWKEKHTNITLLTEDCFIDIKKPEIEFSPFSSKQPKKKFLSNWFIPFELDQASQIIPIMPIQPSPIFKVSGVISSFFWLLPTKIKNEILIQKTFEQRSEAFMEIFSYLFPKISISGTLYQGEISFSVFGNDPASVDAFSSALMSVKASSVPTTKYCRKNKIGMGDLLKIHVQGERFKKPVTKDVQSFKEIFLLYFDPTKCTLCKKCIDLCPFQAIFCRDKTIFYHKKTCNRCGLCVAICPVSAISEI